MLSDKFKQKYRISSTRAMWHDYSGGVYFITICTENMTHYFGEIKNETMYLTDIGKNAKENIDQIKNHYSYCEIPLYVVMPNHIHLIVFIENPVQTVCTPSQKVCTLSQKTQNQQKRWKSDVVDEKMQSISNQKGVLSVVIGGFKGAVSRYANKHSIPFGWQERFHDHIIRNQNELNRIAEYIENNILLWDKDCFNKNNKRL